MMQEEYKMPKVSSNTKQVRFIVDVSDNAFTTEWINYNVVDFTNRVTALVNHNHDFEVEIRHV